VPLADLAISTLANLGQVAEVLVGGADRARYGNDVFGAFGRDLVTADGRRMMGMAITPRQWKGLVAVLGIGAEVAEIENALDVSLSMDEGVRFSHRHKLVPLVALAVGRRKYAELAAAFDRNDVCWG